MVLIEAAGDAGRVAFSLSRTGRLIKASSLSKSPCGSVSCSVMNFSISPARASPRLVTYHYPPKGSVLAIV